MVPLIHWLHFTSWTKPPLYKLHHTPRYGNFCWWFCSKIVSSRGWLLSEYFPRLIGMMYCDQMHYAVATVSNSIRKLAPSKQSMVRSWTTVNSCVTLGRHSVTVCMTFPVTSRGTPLALSTVVVASVMLLWSGYALWWIINIVAPESNRKSIGVLPTSPCT